jgi:hypothetical protein
MVKGRQGLPFIWSGTIINFNKRSLSHLPDDSGGIPPFTYFIGWIDYQCLGSVIQILHGSFAFEPPYGFPGRCVLLALCDLCAENRRRVSYPLPPGI